MTEFEEWVNFTEVFVEDGGQFNQSRTPLKHHVIQKKTVIFSVVGLAVALTACGGGDSSMEQVHDKTVFTVSGNAFDGSVRQTRVAVFEVNGDGVKGVELGNGITDPSGGYSIEVKNYTGVVLVEASAKTDTTTTDATTERLINPASSYVLRASAQSPSGTGIAKALSLHVNPLTEMAVASASRQTGGFSAGNIEKANSDLRASVGFDPTTDQPDFSSGVPINKAAVTLTAVSQMVESDSSSACGSLNNQMEKSQCVIERMSMSGFANNEIRDAFASQLVDIGNTPGVNAANIPVINNITPPAVVEVTPVAQAKALMATLRSNANAINGTDLSLKTELQAVIDEIKYATVPISKHTADILWLAMRGTQMWQDLQGSSATPVLLSRNFFSDGNQGELIGGCTMYSDEGFNIPATDKSNARFIGCGTVSDKIYDADYLKAHFWNVRARIVPKVGTANEFTVYTVTRDALWVYSNGIWSESNPKVRVDYGDITNISAIMPGYGRTVLGSKATLTATKNSAGSIATINFSGEMSPTYTIADSSNPQQLKTVNVHGNKLKAYLSGSVSSSSGTGILTLTGSVAEYASSITGDQLRSTLELISGTALKGNAFNPAMSINRQFNEGDGSYSAKLNLKFSSGSSAVAGRLDLDKFLQDASKTATVPTKISFTGSVARAGSKFFEGNVTAELLNYGTFMANQPLAATNVQSTKGTLTGMVAIKDRPMLNLNLVLTNTDKGVAGRTSGLNGQYSQGVAVINLTGQGGSGRSNVMALESSTGIKLVIDSSVTAHPMTKSGFYVGIFDSSNGRLAYADGSFEQY